MGQRTGSVIENALDYGDALPDGGALIGLDLGTKTIGVATCDAGWRYATAGKTIPRSKFAKDSAKLRNLAETFALPVLLWDERWSTSSAEAAMIGQDMSRAKRAERIDSHAAAIILQGAIDALAGGGL